MVKILFSFFCCFISATTQAQTTKTFDCGLFSFDYPSTFNNIPIQNAPHMVLKLESEEYVVSVSYWDYGLDDNISVWDDEIAEHYNQLPIGNGEVVNVTKEMIMIKNGKQKCLKIKSNINSQVSDRYTFKMLMYLMIEKGYLFVFSFISQGKYTQNGLTAYPDKIMSGLKFKNNDMNLSQFQEKMANVARTLNSQCPFQTDECTIYKNVLLSGKSLMIKLLVEDACNAYVDYDEFKNNMESNMSTALDKEFTKYIDKNGYSIVYLIYNEHDKLKKTLRITRSDILKHYK